MPETHTRLLYHIIFSTKNREPWFVGDLKPRLLAYMAGIVENLGGNALIINGAADHVHILCHLPAKQSISKAVQTIKSNSSQWMHETRRRRAFAWQESYAAFTVSPSRVDSVYAYIENQEEHHRQVSFQDEYLRFLRESGVEFDEKFLW